MLEDRVTDKSDREKIADLEQANADLQGSLERCRELVTECRSKLAANSNSIPDVADAEPGSGRNQA